MDSRYRHGEGQFRFELGHWLDVHVPGWHRATRGGGGVGVQWPPIYGGRGAGLVERPRGTTEESSPGLRRMLAARAFTIGGGTSEVQRTIIGERALRLPRG